MSIVIDKAVAWALSIAEDDSHGYDQGNRWGPDYDCSSLVIQAYENAGVPVKTNGASYTGDMVDVFIKCGFKNVTSTVDLSTGSGLIKGDVVWKSGHVEMISATGQLVGASINENGETTGGSTGDQTGKEIRVRSYYNYPWTVVLRYPGGSSGGFTPPTPISANRYLSLEEMKINAEYIAWYLMGTGWSLNAIAGMLGNMQTESTINPGIWQNMAVNVGPAFGLVQWDPYTKYTNWCDANGLDPAAMDSALKRIEWELENHEQYYATSAYPETFAEFKVSTKDPYYLGMAFLANYERPAEPSQPARGEQAEYWYTYLSGINIDPGSGTSSKRKKKKYNFVLFGRRAWRNHQ